ncbi:E3 ubiquitin-protein ligase [Glycine max]|nr:E3 ubiquitin-protein ligase [Glycine max]
MDGRTVWNLAFVVAAGTVLVLSASEVPGMPRLWIVGYAMQCVLHMVFVCVEYRRQRRQQPAVASSVQDRIGSSSGNLSVSSREGSASASASAQYVSLGQLDDESTRLTLQKVNLGFLGGEVNWAYEAAQILNCSQMETPFYYLGIPIGVGASDKKNLKLKYPNGTRKIYPWGGDQEHKKIHWVKWDVICLPKIDGGLGIKDISKFNAALTSDQQQLWARIIISKYGGWTKFQNGRDKGSDFSFFHQNMAWKVGCGNKINFWTYNWLGEDCTLEQKYNSLFLSSRQQNNLISMMGNFAQDNWSWDLKWRRNLFDHEIIVDGVDGGLL